MSRSREFFSSHSFRALNVLPYWVEINPPTDCGSEYCSREYRGRKKNGELKLTRMVHYSPCKRAKKGKNINKGGRNGSHTS